MRPGRRDTIASVTQPRAYGPLLHYRINNSGAVIALDTVRFSVQQSGPTLTFTSSAPAVTISYTQSADGYRTNVRGSVAGAGANATLLIDLPTLQLEVIRTLKESRPTLGLLVLMHSYDLPEIISLLKAGATGCISRDATVSDLARAIIAAPTTSISSWMEARETRSGSQRPPAC